jgi:hypothetical protein
MLLHHLSLFNYILSPCRDFKDESYNCYCKRHERVWGSVGIAPLIHNRSTMLGGETHAPIALV